ncbi:MAG: hypothetical protein KAS04_01895 [Candidatus Aenigmarchaeota archaeon]|nr:hypothetical protein [Candidatus Aenigmarchaeota archaeon]
MKYTEISNLSLFKANVLDVYMNRLKEESPLSYTQLEPEVQEFMEILKNENHIKAGLTLPDMKNIMLHAKEERRYAEYIESLFKHQSYEIFEVFSGLTEGLTEFNDIINDALCVRKREICEACESPPEVKRESGVPKNIKGMRLSDFADYPKP